MSVKHFFHKKEAVLICNTEDSRRTPPEYLCTMLAKADYWTTRDGDTLYWWKDIDDEDLERLRIFAESTAFCENSQVEVLCDGYVKLGYGNYMSPVFTVCVEAHLGVDGCSFPKIGD